MQFPRARLSSSHLPVMLMIFAICPCSAPTAAGQAITVDGAQIGQKFEGIGGVFGNGMERLVKDYPSTQRQDILNLLFEKKYGAGLQHVKIEIGSDTNTSAGTEPSHMRTATDSGITRGSLLWLAQEAKAINPDIKLDALRWGTPSWITNDTQKYAYYKSFLQGAQSLYGLSFNYLGPDQNEGSFSRDWVVNTLRPNLTADSFTGITLVAADQTGGAGWNIATQILDDPDLRVTLGALTAHYTENSSVDAQTAQANNGKKLWAGEDLAPPRNSFLNTMDFVFRIVKSYVNGKMTKYEMDPGVEASYSNLPFGYKSILVATWPWSGHYEIASGLWATAQFTQFADPGWYYIDSACTADAHGGSLAFKDSASSNWSIVFVNYSAEPVTHTVNITGGLSTGTLHVWKTSETVEFAQQSNIIPSAGSFTITLDPYSIYSLTTTTGQQKGSPIIPATKELSLPYTDNFDSYTVGSQPKYMIDQGGAFEVASGNGGKVLQQQITDDIKATDWNHETTPNPFTVFGSPEWKNYQVQVDAKITDSDGYILVGGRATHLGKPISINALPDGYNLQIKGNGDWFLRNKLTVAASGNVSGFALNTWYTLKLRFLNTTVQAYVQGNQIASITAGYLASGSAFLGSSYHIVQFDNLSVTPIDGTTPVSTKRSDDKDTHIIYQGEWQDKDSDQNDFSRSLTMSHAAGATMDATFNGTTVSVIGHRDLGGGQAQVFIDGVLKSTIDVYTDTTGDLDANGNPLPQFHQAIFNQTGLSAGNHTLTLKVLGTKQVAATDAYIWVDAIESIGGTGLVTPSPIATTALANNFDSMTAGTEPTDSWIVTEPTSTSALTAAAPMRTGNALMLSDNSTSASAKAVKKFSPIGGTVEISYDYLATTVGKWNRMIVKGLEVHAVEVYDTDSDGLCYSLSDGTKVPITSISANTWYTIKIDLNLATHTFDLYVNNAQYVFGAALYAPGITTVDRVDFESGVSYTGTSYYDNVMVTTPGLYARTYVNDNFDTEPGFSGVSNWNSVKDPLNWGISVTPGAYPAYPENSNAFVRVDQNVPGSGNQSMTLYDFHSTKGVVATRRFARITDRTLTVSYRFMVDAPVTDSIIAIRGHNDAVVQLTDTPSNGLTYTNSSGAQIRLMNITADTWYDVRIIANPVYSVYDLYINDQIVLNDQPMITSTVSDGLDNMTFYTSYTDPVGSGCVLHVDNVIVSAP